MQSQNELLCEEPQGKALNSQLDRIKKSNTNLRSVCDSYWGVHLLSIFKLYFKHTGKCNYYWCDCCCNCDNVFLDVFVVKKGRREFHG